MSPLPCFFHCLMAHPIRGLQFEMNDATPHSIRLFCRCSQLLLHQSTSRFLYISINITLSTAFYRYMSNNIITGEFIRFSRQIMLIKLILLFYHPLFSLPFQYLFLLCIYIFAFVNSLVKQTDLPTPATRSVFQLSRILCCDCGFSLILGLVFTVVVSHTEGMRVPELHSTPLGIESRRTQEIADY